MDGQFVCTISARLLKQDGCGKVEGGSALGNIRFTGVFEPREYVATGRMAVLGVYKPITLGLRRDLLAMPIHY